MTHVALGSRGFSVSVSFASRNSEHLVRAYLLMTSEVLNYAKNAKHMATVAFQRTQLLLIRDKSTRAGEDSVEDEEVVEAYDSQK